MDAGPDLRVRVFVVWEPVIASDLAPPTTGTLSRIHDRRAVQYWDHDRALSADIVRAIMAAPERYDLAEEQYADSIVWDTVAVFPPGARWEQEFPVPTFYRFPVVDAAPELGRALSSASMK